LTPAAIAIYSDQPVLGCLKTGIGKIRPRPTPTNTTLIASRLVVQLFAYFRVPASLDIIVIVVVVVFSLRTVSRTECDGPEGAYHRHESTFKQFTDPWIHR